MPAHAALVCRAGGAPAMTGVRMASDAKPRCYLELFLVSFAVIVLEISYTRVFSFKLFYYFTYLIIGIALLGLGAGGVLIATWPALRRLGPRRLVPRCGIAGGLAVPLGYLLIAATQLNTLHVADQVAEVLKLALVCAALFAQSLAGGAAPGGEDRRARDAAGQELPEQRGAHQRELQHLRDLVGDVQRVQLRRGDEQVAERDGEPAGDAAAREEAPRPEASERRPGRDQHATGAEAKERDADDRVREVVEELEGEDARVADLEYDHGEGDEEELEVATRSL